MVLFLFKIIVYSLELFFLFVISRFEDIKNIWMLFIKYIIVLFSINE